MGKRSFWPDSVISNIASRSLNNVYARNVLLSSGIWIQKGIKTHCVRLTMDMLIVISLWNNLPDANAAFFTLFVLPIKLPVNTDTIPMGTMTWGGGGVLSHH